jgi:hypothetical protein
MKKSPPLIEVVPSSSSTFLQQQQQQQKPTSLSSSSSSWLSSNERVSVDDVSIPIRVQGEQRLVSELMNIVQQTKNLIVQKSGNRRSDVLTNIEQDVFSRYTYYGYQYGIPAGLFTFTILYGGLRYNAYRTFLKEFNLPNTELYHTNIVSRRQQYTMLDRPKQTKPIIVSSTTTSGSGSGSTTGSSATITATTANTTASTTMGGRVNTHQVATELSKPLLATLNNVNVPATATTATAASSTMSITTKPIITLFSTKSNSTFALFPNEAIVTIQLYITVAIGLFVSVCTWNTMFDWDRLHADISKLPLQSGPSVYCYVLCRDLMERHYQIVHHNIHIPITTTTTTTTTTTATNTKTDDGKTKDDSSNKSISDNDEAESTEPTLKIIQLSAKELWDDPISENLYHMVQLVNHCQQRVQYEKECEKRKVRLVHQNSYMNGLLLVDVPEPSLPLRYHTRPTNTSTITASATTTTNSAK